MIKLKNIIVFVALLLGTIALAWTISDGATDSTYWSPWIRWEINPELAKGWYDSEEIHPYRIDSVEWYVVPDCDSTSLISTPVLEKPWFEPDVNVCPDTTFIDTTEELSGTYPFTTPIIIGDVDGSGALDIDDIVASIQCIYAGAQCPVHDSVDLYLGIEFMVTIKDNAVDTIPTLRPLGLEARVK